MQDNFVLLLICFIFLVMVSSGLIVYLSFALYGILNYNFFSSNKQNIEGKPKLMQVILAQLSFISYIPFTYFISNKPVTYFISYIPFTYFILYIPFTYFISYIPLTYFLFASLSLSPFLTFLLALLFLLCSLTIFVIYLILSPSIYFVIPNSFPDH